MPDARPLHWPKSHRIIRTIYPPVHLFEDIADPADWEALVSAEAKSNPRVRDDVGNLALVPIERRLSGPGASFVMGAFTHVSRDRPSRFSDGSYGVWYCGDRFEVALAETAYHFAAFMRRTEEAAADADFRELTCSVGGTVLPIDAADCLAPDDWSAGQAAGRAARAAGQDGVVYPSVRWPAGQALALFWPDCVALPVLQGRQMRYRWNGSRMTEYFIHGSRNWTSWP